MNIEWTGSQGDYTANVDGYTLRAEMIDLGVWLWRCYAPDGRVWSNRYADSGKKAKEYAVKAMNEHKGKQ